MQIFSKNVLDFDHVFIEQYGDIIFCGILRKFNKPTCTQPKSNKKINSYNNLIEVKKVSLNSDKFGKNVDKFI